MSEPGGAPSLDIFIAEGDQPNQLRDQDEPRHESRRDVVETVVGAKDVFLRDQQQHEPDIDLHERRRLVAHLMDNQPLVFLTRYGHLLSPAQLEFLETSMAGAGDEVTFVAAKLRSESDLRRKQTVVKNRRYAALQQLIKEGNYFSDREMIARNPLLFEQKVGRYLSPGDWVTLRQEVRDYNTDTERPLTSFLMEQLEKNKINRMMQIQTDREEGAVQEEEEEEDVEETSDRETEEDTNEPRTAVNFISNDEKLCLKREFERIMFDHFLEGKDDRFFDYSNVDHNEDYDLLETQDRDAEDDYFDSEEPS